MTGSMCSLPEASLRCRRVRSSCRAPVRAMRRGGSAGSSMSGVGSPSSATMGGRSVSGPLRIAPGKELAVALVSNFYTSGALYEQLFRKVFEELRGIRMPQRPQPPEDGPPAFDLGSYPGSYERRGVLNVVSKPEEQLLVDQTLAGELAELEGEGQGKRALLPTNETTFFVYDKDVEEHHPPVLSQLYERTAPASLRRQGCPSNDLTSRSTAVRLYLVATKTR